MEAKMGVQLYSLRDYIKSERALEKVIKGIADIGYDGVELAGIENISGKASQDIVGSSGLSVPAMHIPWIRFQQDIDEVIEELKGYQCENAVIPGVFSSEYRNAAGLVKFAKEVSDAARTLKKEGITLSYHNHNHELCRYGDASWLEQLYKKVSSELLYAELDIYWLQMGGASPVSWIEKYSGRQILLHLKDCVVTQDRLDDTALAFRLQAGVGAEQRVTEVGNGNMDIEGAVRAGREAGVNWYIVEQDEAFDRTPLEAVEVSYMNLKNILQNI